MHCCRFSNLSSALYSSRVIAVTAIAPGSTAAQSSPLEEEPTIRHIVERSRWRGSELAAVVHRVARVGREIGGEALACSPYE